MEAIYREITETSFETSLKLIQSLLNSRLTESYTKIWIQGRNVGRARFLFTVFNSSGQYQIISLQSNSFRNYRHDGSLNEEIVHIERFIESLRRGVLADIIS